MSPEKENSLNDFANTDPIYMWRGAQKLWRSDTQFQSGLSSSVESERQNYFLFVFGGSDYISSWNMPVFRLFAYRRSQSYKTMSIVEEYRGLGEL